MNFGMLWFDNDPKRTLADKIKRAGQYYYDKYSKVPNYCEVNPDTHQKGTKVSGVKIEKSATILTNHIWIGKKGEIE